MSRLRPARAAGAPHDERHGGERDDGEDHPVHHVPAIGRDDLARRERADRHDAEDAEVIDRLDARALLGARGRGHHGAGADIAEVPAEPEQHQGGVEVRHGEAEEGHHRRERGEHQTHGDDARRAIAGDEAAGEEARRIHGDDVPLDAIGRVVDRMVAADHGEWGGRHDEVHEHVGGRATDDRGDEGGVLEELDRRSRHRAGGRRLRLRDVDEGEDDAGEQRHDRLADIGAGEENRRQGILGPDHELRADHAGDDPAGHDPGDRLGPEAVGGGVGGRETVALGGGGIEAGAEGREAEDGEARQRDAQIAEEASEHAGEGRQLVGCAAAIAAHQHADGQRGRGKTHDEDRDRQRRQRADRCKLRADNGARREHDGGVGARQRGRDREDDGVAPRKAVADGSGVGGRGGHGHHAGRDDRIALRSIAGQTISRTSQGKMIVL